jgi:hypothetical protein
MIRTIHRENIKKKKLSVDGEIGIEEWVTPSPF